MKYIIGLGNPGSKYEYTRHNVGAFVLDYVRRKFDLSRWEKDALRNSFVSKGKIADEDVEFIFPQTFMNRSGESVKDIAGTEKTGDLIVVHDDIDLPLGTIRISQGRGTGGHNGVESIVDHIHTKDFVRVRIGIIPTHNGEQRKPNGGEEVEKFVLGRFSDKDLEIIKEIEEKVASAIGVIIEKGEEEAMNLFNAS